MEPDSATGTPGLAALSALRKFVRPRVVRERCELCDAPLAEEHCHMVETSSRQLICACDPCAILFSNQGVLKYRRVPRRVRLLRDFLLTDEAWEPVGVCLTQPSPNRVRGAVYGDVPADRVKHQVARILSLDVDGRGWPAGPKACFRARPVWGLPLFRSSRWKLRSRRYPL